MIERIRENLTTLATLQRIDSKRGEVRKELEGVDARIASLNEEVATVETQVADARQKLEDLKKAYRSDENELKSIESATGKSEQKLSAVKTNKEYQSTLKEIEELKQKASAIQDQMLASLENIEAAEAQVKILLADLTDVQKGTDEQQSEIKQQADRQQKELTTLDTQRESVWADLEPKLQKTYERACRQGKGVAVAAVVDGVCQVCRMNLPPQAFIELMRMDDLFMCPACQRLMYPKNMIDD